jgi:hypothetical protein
MNLLSLLLMIPFGFNEKTFSTALALSTNRFTMLFNYVPFTVADYTDHFSLPVNGNCIAIKRGAVTGQGYTRFECGWQEELRLIEYECYCRAWEMLNEKSGTGQQADLTIGKCWGSELIHCPKQSANARQEKRPTPCDCTSMCLGKSPWRLGSRRMRHT